MGAVARVHGILFKKLYTGAFYMSKFLHYTFIMRRKRPAYPLKVFYDGSCSVCSGAIDGYRKEAPEGAMDFIDITAPDFNPGIYGRTREDFMRQINVMDAEGSLYLGVEGLWAIWQAYPPHSSYGIMGRLVSLPGIHTLARLFYWTFARFRKYLSGRH
jgi:predicted DCC family thiol-disulfide oxidoreductase YuxK